MNIMQSTYDKNGNMLSSAEYMGTEEYYRIETVFEAVELSEEQAALLEEALTMLVY